MAPNVAWRVALREASTLAIAATRGKSGSGGRECHAARARGADEVAVELAHPRSGFA